MEKRKKKFLLACVVLAAAGIIWLVSGAGFRSGTVFMRIESGGAKSWSLSFDRASDGFVNTHTLRMDEGEALRADVTYAAGELVLTIRQKEREETTSFGPDSSPMVIPLDDFDKGRLQLKLVSHGAEDVESKFELIK